MKREEQRLQEHFSGWLDAKKVLYTASMVGVFLPVKYAVMRKRMGVKSGYPDIFIAEPRGKFLGLFLELKSKSGCASAEQKEWQIELNKRGYLCISMQSGLEFSEAFNYLRDTVEQYLNLK